MVVSALTDALSSFVQLMPLLIRGLEVPDADVRANVIETLHASASAKEKDNDNDTGRNVFAEHTSTLVSAMIKNSDFKKMHSVVRCLIFLVISNHLILYFEARSSGGIAFSWTNPLCGSL
jgi:DNA repair/transcription protein MET18/MMS19